VLEAIDTPLRVEELTLLAAALRLLLVRGGHRRAPPGRTARIAAVVRACTGGAR
jgi:hypothetical protein